MPVLEAAPLPAQSRRRWLICALLFAATTINYMDRQVLSLLAPQLQSQFGWTEMQYAHVVTAFSAAYTVGLLFFGWFVDRFGAKLGYSLAVILWSIFAMAHGLAQTVLGFGVARAALGFGEAGNFPAAVRAVADWFPKTERALAAGIFNSGANVGAILAPLIVPWMAITFGWQSAFVCLGLLGFIWLPFWHFIFARPEPLYSSSALSTTQEEEPTVHAGETLSWHYLLSLRQTWAYIAGSALSSPVWWFYLYWLPKFLHAKYGMESKKIGIALMVIYSMTCFGSIGGGWLSSAFIQRGWTINSGRKIALLVCALAAMPVVFVGSASHWWVATFLIGLAASAHQGWSANLYALASDLFPVNAVASVVGIGGIVAAIFTMLLAQVAGVILQNSSSYTLLFEICGFSYLSAFVMIHLLTPQMRPLSSTSSR